MPVRLRWLLAVSLVIAGAGTARAASDATIFRIFLKDGTAVPSYGEFSRVDGRVIFSVPVGGSSDEPRLHVVSMPATQVDWARTDRYAASARFDQYARTRGEIDFIELSNEVARVLNDVALASDRAQALAAAEQARRKLADWPREHFGYRAADVREIVALIDEAIIGLKAPGASPFDLSLVAPPIIEVPDRDSLLPLPTARERLSSVLRLAQVVETSSERVALLQSALTMINDANALGVAETTAIRRDVERRIRSENSTDQRYAKMTTKVTTQATKAASAGRIATVERLITRIEREDSKLGRRRPETVQALRANVEGRLEDARRQRLLRDQWEVRRGLYRDYEKVVGSQIRKLVEAQSSLEAIRRLDGPKPAVLISMRTQFSGGAERLSRVPIQQDLRNAHDLLVGAWRFAETAVRSRQEAVSTGNVARAWEASSAAAGALMMISRAQVEIRELLEPPKLQ
jgi:hypothetical protein